MCVVQTCKVGYDSLPHDHYIRGWSGGRHRKRLLKSRGRSGVVHYNVVEARSGSKSEWYKVGGVREEREQVPY